MKKYFLHFITWPMIFLVVSCSDTDWNYGKVDCGDTFAQEDQCDFTPTSFDGSYTSYNEAVAGSIVGNLLCIQPNFCPLDSIYASIDFKVGYDSVDIYVGSYIIAGEDTTFIDLSWEQSGEDDHYFGSGKMLPSAKSDAEHFTVYIEFIFPDQGSAFNNNAFIKEYFREGTVNTRYTKKGL